VANSDWTRACADEQRTEDPPCPLSVHIHPPSPVKLSRSHQGDGCWQAQHTQAAQRARNLGLNIGPGQHKTPRNAVAQSSGRRGSKTMQLRRGAKGKFSVNRTIRCANHSRARSHHRYTYPAATAYAHHNAVSLFVFVTLQSCLEYSSIPMIGIPNSCTVRGGLECQRLFSLNYTSTPRSRLNRIAMTAAEEEWMRC
jgi:hypothetical protein